MKGHEPYLFLGFCAGYTFALLIFLAQNYFRRKDSK